MALPDHGLEDLVLHVPAALRERIEEMALRECLSLNLFVVMAVAEKVQRLELEHSIEIAEQDHLASAANGITESLIH